MSKPTKRPLLEVGMFPSMSAARHGAKVAGPEWYAVKRKGKFHIKRKGK